MVFLHGILGADVIRRLWPGFRYFRGLGEALKATGISVYFPSVPSGGSIVGRARALKLFVDQVHADCIHLIAHSMGGLDGRYLITHCDPDARIRSLTTIGTPHHGSELVHWVANTSGPWQLFARCLLYPGILELTPQACEQFNRDTPDRPDVRYQSWAGCRPVQEMPVMYRNQARILRRAEGDNDCQVSVASATWGTFRGVLRADHLELVGWSLGRPKSSIQRPFDHIAFFQSLVNRITVPETVSGLQVVELPGGDRCG